MTLIYIEYTTLIIAEIKKATKIYLIYLSEIEKSKQQSSRENHNHR
jgi:hypothetical protein